MQTFRWTVPEPGEDRPTPDERRRTLGLLGLVYLACVGPLLPIAPISPGGVLLLVIAAPWTIAYGLLGPIVGEPSASFASAIGLVGIVALVVAAGRWSNTRRRLVLSGVLVGSASCSGSASAVWMAIQSV